jgi:hypothetical protein
MLEVLRVIQKCDERKMEMTADVVTSVRPVDTPTGPIFVSEIPGEDPPIILMHGFPDDHHPVGGNTRGVVGRRSRLSYEHHRCYCPGVLIWTMLGISECAIRVPAKPPAAMPRRVCPGSKEALLGSMTLTVSRLPQL